MIRFALNCSRDHAFEGWFKSGDAFAKQVEVGQIACPTCGDRAVRKAVMAPAVVRSSGREVAPGLPQARELSSEQVQAASMMAMLRQVREHVVRNFEDVGDRFPDEVRRMHREETEHRNVYGKATQTEARDLLEEGILVRPLPELPELDG